jgi:hypothetical protein
MVVRRGRIVKHNGFEYVVLKVEKKRAWIVRLDSNNYPYVIGEIPTRKFKRKKGSRNLLTLKSNENEY